MRDLDSQISIYADYSNVTIYSFLHNADFIIKEWSSYLKFNRSRSEYRFVSKDDFAGSSARTRNNCYGQGSEHAVILSGDMPCLRASAILVFSLLFR